MFIFCVSAIASTFVGILIFKSIVECILYSIPMTVRMLTNMSAFIADVITIIISIPLAISLKKPLSRLNG